MTAIRAARADDADAIAAIYAPHVERGSVSFETRAPDAVAIAGRMAAAVPLYPWLVAEDPGEGGGRAGGAILGYAYAGAFGTREAYRWAVETTIYIAEDGQRRGVGRRLYGALLATLGAQGFTQAIGRIALPNIVSITLHEALGFRAVGVLQSIGWKGRWIDVGLWQCPLGEDDAAPPEPRGFPAIGVQH